MKDSIILIALLVAIAANAQTGATVSGSSAALPKPTPFQIVERGANHQVFERIVYSPGTNGTVVARKSRYTELSGGLNFLNSYGQWSPSREEINILPQGGAGAVNGQVKANFPGDIYKGAVTLVTPDGKQLKGHPFCLSYDDGTNTVLLAVLTNSAGMLVGSNRVVYPDAFTGIKADIVYEYRKGGFSQSVVLREQPPTPESLGLDSRAQLQLLTEFTGSPDPAQKAAARDAKDNLQDNTLSFGAGATKLTMIQGRAFSIGGGGSAKTKTPSYKSWMRLQNRTFLIETVPYQQLAPQLKQLPMMSRLEMTGTNLLAANSILGKVSPHRLLPPALESQPDTGKILLASVDPSRQPGVVLDYEAVVSSTADFDFASNETYYVSGGVYLSGLTTIAGGTVIKYDTNYVCGVNILGTVQCTTSPNQPAVLTSADDNTVGEPITTGGPNNGTGSLTLWIAGDSGVNLADLTFWIQDGNGNYIVNGQPLIPSRYWEQWQGHDYEPLIFPTGLGQGYIVWAAGDGKYWGSSFSPTLNTGTLTLQSDNPYCGYYPASYSETGDPLATQAGGAVGLSLPNGTSVNDLIIRNLGTGVQSGYGLCSATNVQFIHCGVAFELEAYASLYAGNVLMSQVNLGFSGQDFWATAEHLTFDQGSFLAEDASAYNYSSLTLNNSLLTGIADCGNVALSTNAVVMLPSGSGVYQTAANGNYLGDLAPNSFDDYLAPGSPYRNIGTTAIDPNLLAQLQKTTTYAPQDGGWPDNDGMPDLGYHHVMIGDSDYDGIPDWWILSYFGNSSYNATTLDATGANTLLTDYSNYLAHGTAPAVFSFAGVEVTNDYVRSSSVPVQLDVAGYPYYVAVAVDDTNYLNDATWGVYTSANINVPLGTKQGWHDVWIGLRGHADNPAHAVWQEVELNLDLTPLVLAITNPALTNGAATVIKPYLQVQGFANKDLDSLSYDISNSTGIFTGQDVSVVDQVLDTNTIDYSTNFFQAYDVPLATNDNLITLHASDRAGNTAVTNFDVILDYSGATNPPVVGFGWPANAMLVSGTNITIRGVMSDETGTIEALVTNGDGTASVIPGLVERDHTFWIENVPVNGTGPVDLLLQATDAAGNVTMTNLTINPSSVVLTIDSTPTGTNLWSPSGSVEGTVSDEYATVIVNGVTVVTNGEVVGGYFATDGDSWWDGQTLHWVWYQVPIYGQGTATFDVVAYTNGMPAANASIAIEKPAYCMIVDYACAKTYDSLGTDSQDTGHFHYTSTKKYSVQTNVVAGGPWHLTYAGSLDEKVAGQGSGGPYEHIYTWSDINSGTEQDYDNGSVYYSDVFPPYYYSGPSWFYQEVLSVPDEDSTNVTTDGHTPNMMYHYYASRNAHYIWTEPHSVDSESVTARTVTKLYTGGKAVVGRKSLAKIHVDATEYGKPPGNGQGWWMIPGWWYATPSTSINPTDIEVLGWGALFGQYLDSSGNDYGVLPDGAELNLNLRIPGVAHYSATPTVTKYKLVHETVNPALTDTNLARLNLGVGEEVRFGFTPAFAWPPVQWSASAGGLSSYPYWRDAAGEAVTNGTGFTAPSNAANVTVTASFFGVDGSLKTKFKVLEPSGVDHAVIVSTNETGYTFGTGVAGAMMHLTVFMKPTDVSFYRVLMEEVGKDATNVTGCFTNSYPAPSHIGNGADEPFQLNWDNSWPTYFDYCCSPLAPYAYPPQWSTGSYTWNIPWNWCIDSSNIHSNSIGWQQVFTLDESGTVKITKFGSYWVQRTTNNFITNSPPH